MSFDTYRAEAKMDSGISRLAQLLIDQERARVVVPPQQNASGFWFGGGNLSRSPQGDYYIVGRYRNVGDSRTGLGAGQRGVELAIFRSQDRCETFHKVLSLGKHDLNVGDRTVLSIEGSALEFTDRGVRLLVSTEKTGIPYPEGLQSYHKPGTGVWTIEELVAPSLHELADAERVTILQSDVPEHLHVKDPFLMPALNGQRRVGFCTHPFNWSSSNTSIAVEEEPGRWTMTYGVLPRGDAWDVAISRGTSVLDMSLTGLPGTDGTTLLFYDGGECMRPLDEHAEARKRPRGYSCEELGGLAVIERDSPLVTRRITRFEAGFVSPKGTGCSRYVDVFFDSDRFIATWQQGQSDGSQPLVMNIVSVDAVGAAIHQND